MSSWAKAQAQMDAAYELLVQAFPDSVIAVITIYPSVIEMGMVEVPTSAYWHVEDRFVISCSKEGKFTFYGSRTQRGKLGQGMVNTSMDLRTLSEFITKVNKILDKVETRFAIPQEIQCIGHMNFDPVPGESDYVEVTP